MNTDAAVIWTLTDGKVGDRVQCEGVAAAVVELLGAGRVEHHVVAPRPAFAWMAPWGPMDPGDRPGLALPPPDILIASGRRAVPAFRMLRRRTPAMVAIFLKDPRYALDADLIWVPEHDRRRGPGVLVTPTSPHAITPGRLEEARRGVRPELAALPAPRVAVLLGGATAGVPFGDADIGRLAAMLLELRRAGVALAITPSRRTPAPLVAALRASLAGPSVWIWDGEGPNPYLEMLATADAFVVTGDSMNMIGEAAATGRPIHIFSPQGLKTKQRRAIQALVRLGAAVPFAGRLERLAYEPLNATPEIARAVVQLYRARRLS